MSMTVTHMASRSDVFDERHTGAACLTVMYHYVRAPSQQTGSSVKAISIDDFKSQIDWLCARFEPVRWPQLIRWLHGEGEIPRHSFLLTFDDGLKEHADVVAPILESRGLRGVFFISTQPLAEAQPLSAHMLHRLVDSVPHDQLISDVDHELEKHGFYSRRLSADDHRNANQIYYYEISTLRRLKYLLNYVLKPGVRYRLLNRLLEQKSISSAGFVRDWYMDSEELQSLYHRGHTIGGHGHGHEPYRTLSSAAQQDDLQRCHDYLCGQGIGGHIPFSFPFGSYEAATLDRCRAAGFAAAFTTEETQIQFSSDPYMLPRIDTIHVFNHRELQRC